MFRSLVRIALLGYSLIGSAALAEGTGPKRPPTPYGNPNHGVPSTTTTPTGNSTPTTTPINPANRRPIAPVTSATPAAATPVNSPAFTNLEKLYGTGGAPLLSALDKNISSLTLCTANGAKGQQGIAIFHFFNNLEVKEGEFRFGVIAQPVEKIPDPAKFRERADDAVRVLSDTAKYSKDQIADAKMIEQLVQLNRQRTEGATASLARLSQKTPIHNGAMYFHRNTGIVTANGDGPYTSYSIRGVRLPETGQQTYVIRVEEGTQKWNAQTKSFERKVSRTLYCR